MKTILTLAVIAALAAPLAAAPSAEARTCAQARRARGADGTIIGGLGGALLGGAVAGHGAKTEGAVLGGVVGAVAGHQIGKHGAHCYNSTARRSVPVRTASAGGECRWQDEYYGGQNHRYRVCRGGDGVWRAGG